MAPQALPNNHIFPSGGSWRLSILTLILITVVISQIFSNTILSKWYLHPDDTYLQSLAQSSARRWGFDAPTPAVADEVLEPGTIMEFGSLKFQILHTPGHTLGGCCLNLLVEDGANHLFVGDTLFAGSVGRTDLPDTGGDFDVLATSIHTQLWPLEADTVVYPGHGPLTTIGHERATNPFVGEGAGPGGMYGRGKYA